MKFRKKPVEIEAVQWWVNGDGPGEDGPTGGEGSVVRYFRRPEVEYEGTKVHDVCGRTWHVHGWIDTYPAGHNVCPGDWIVTGVLGYRRPVKPDVFELTYEAVDG